MTSKEIRDALAPLIAGDIDDSDARMEEYSHDASLFEVRPQIAIFPKDAKDVSAVMKWVAEHKKDNPTLSITGRSAGTDMSGGAVNDSIILNFTRYMNKIISVTDELAVVQPGCFYRDFEKETLKHGRIVPSYPASRELCTVGGMASNNSGGEKTIKYGKTERYIAHLRVVFTDGNEYLVKPLDRAGLETKCTQQDFEGGIYRTMRDLILKNQAEIQAAKPNVSKNSAGYYLWNVWNEKGPQGPADGAAEAGMFDLCRLICGSQGTLGMITEIGFRLVPTKPYSGMLIIFMPSLDRLPDVVTHVMKYSPDSFESYDDYSLKLAIRFFFDFFVQMGFVRAIKLGVQFIPDLGVLLTTGLPKLTLMAEFTGDSNEEIQSKLKALRTDVAPFGFKTRIAKSAPEAEKYWEVRRQSFNLLRKHVHGKRTAPFIDDIIVRPEHLPEFFPKLNAILAKYPDLIYTIAGHAGDGNFHIIPLMDLKKAYSADEILEVSHQVYKLVIENKGSITAEHNDGIIRTPYLLEMYGPKIVALFQQTKNTFDPLNILNPGKKVGGTFEDIKKKLIRKNN